MKVMLEKGKGKYRCRNCLYYEKGYCKFHKIVGEGNGIKSYSYLPVNPDWYCSKFANKQEYQNLLEASYINVIEQTIAEEAGILLESHTIYQLARKIFNIFREKLLT